MIKLISIKYSGVTFFHFCLMFRLAENNVNAGIIIPKFHSGAY